MYEKGLGTEKDINKAFEHYKQLAKQGSDEDKLNKPWRDLGNK